MSYSLAWMILNLVLDRIGRAERKRGGYSIGKASGKDNKTMTTKTSEGR